MPAGTVDWTRSRGACIVLALLALASLAFAFLLQYGFGFSPCALCLKERVAFALLFLAGIGGYLTGASRSWLFVCLLVLFGTVALTFYHVGIEQGWFESTAACTGAGTANSVDDLRDLLEHAKPSCDQPAWLIRDHLSIAQATLFWSILLTIYAVAVSIISRFRQ